MRRLLVFLPWLLLAACSVQEQEISIPAQVLPAAGVARLNLDVNVGRVSITPSTDGQVHVTLSLKPSTSFFGMFTNGASVTAVQKATITHSLENGVLTLGVQYPANTDSSDISEHWSVALPPAVAVTGHVNVGDLNISGIAGGADVSMNVGKVQLDVPGGPLKVSVNVGKIQASAHSLNYADIALGAGVGEAGLTVEGVSAGDMHKTGAGETLNYKLNGKNSISLQVTTGSVKLALLTH
ncbi:MAG TPA: hypothetical protein VJS16_04600 [Gammaproteobacteria bacterium]|nr:hypothetical protein [Gammaproteobacteria bacterium]